MQQKLHLLDPKIRFNLLLSSLIFSCFVLFILNITVSIMTITRAMELFENETLNTNFTNGYFTLNQQRIGFPLLFNIIGFFVLWYVMFQYTKKNILKN